jgi:hypothetical protein
MIAFSLLFLSHQFLYKNIQIIHGIMKNMSDKSSNFCNNPKIRNEIIQGKRMKKLTQVSGSPFRSV